MKIILLEDIKTLGKRDTIVNVNDGYARNYILPKKLGVEATPGNIKAMEKRQAEEHRMEEERYAEALQLKEKIEAMNLSIPVKVGENGKLFGSISAKEVAEAVKKKYSLEIDKKKLQLAENMKSTGEYECRVKIHPKVSAVLKVKLRAE